MKKILILTGFIFWMMFSGIVFASQLKVDDAHTEVRFEVQHIYAKTSGRFSDFKGDVFFDTDNLTASRFNFTVDVKSINTFNNKRDKHLLSKDFFDAKKFPKMIFKSQKISLIKNNLYSLEGMITIKDVTKPIKIQFSHFGPIQNPFKKSTTVTGFNASFSLNRLDFNVGDGRFLKMGVMGDMVNVKIEMETLGK